MIHSANSADSPDPSQSGTKKRTATNGPHYEIEFWNKEHGILEEDNVKLEVQTMT